MKKIFVFLFAFVSILLVSCKKDTEIVTRRDNPHDDNVAALNLGDVKSGVELSNTDTSASSYYSIKTATNLSDSLFVFETDLDETFEYHKNRGEKVKEASIYILSFSAEITDEEVLGILSAISSSDISDDKLGLSADLNVSFRGTTTTNIVDYYDAYKNDDVKGNKIKTIYLPTYVERVVDSKTVLAVYVMVPVYYEVISNNKAASNVFDGIDTPTLLFNEETKLLASKEA